MFDQQEGRWLPPEEQGQYSYRLVSLKGSLLHPGILLDALEQVVRYGLALTERPSSPPLLDALGAALLRAWMAWPAG
jgi:hypothetical protein